MDPVTEAQSRWANSPRPLDFVRVRYYRGGPAEYVLSLFSGERDALLGDLGKLRGAGKQEDDPELIQVTTEIRYLNSAIRDLSNGLIELVGIDGY